MSGISGFPSSQKVVTGTGTTSNFATVIPTDPYRNAIETPRFAFRVDSDVVPRTAGANTGIEEIDRMKVFWVEDTATPAMVGDFVRFEDGAAEKIEISIVKVETNRFALAINNGLLPAAGDTFYILRYATQRVDDDGTQLVAVTPAPIAFEKDGVDTTVKKDTITPANSEPLPVAQFNLDGTPFDPLKQQVAFIRNGVEVKVTEDTVTPGNNIPLPVKLTSVTGDINITAGDLNVQLSDQGANPDVTRIGDGTNQLGMTAANEAKVNAAQLPTVLGQTTMSGSTSVTIASDQTAVKTAVDGILSSTNSTSINLAGGATFTGVGEEALDYGSISIAIYASHNSATLGLKFQASDDNVTWYDTDTYNYVASSGMQTYSLAPVARYFRIVYVNGATPTTTLRIQTIYRYFYVKPSSHRIGDNITAENDAELTKSVLTGQRPDGSYTSVDCTTAGNLKMSVQEFDPAVFGQETMANSLPVTVASDQTLPISAVSLPLPAGAATETTLSTLNTKVANDYGVSTGAVRIAAQIGNASGAADFGAGATTAQTVRTVLANDIVLNTKATRSKVDLLFNDYTSTSVTTAAYVELIASTSADTNKLEIFDSSGEAMILAVGAAASEVDQLYILPGGNGPVELYIPSGSRVSIKAKTATASVGFVAINLYS